MKMSNWQKSVDESLLGLLKPDSIMNTLQSLPTLPSMESLLQSLPSLPLIPSIETALQSAPAMPALPVPTVTFPALTSQINVLMDRVKGNSNLGLNSFTCFDTGLLTHPFL